MNNLATFLAYSSRQQSKKLQEALTDITADIEFEWAKGNVAEITDDFIKQTPQQQLMELQNILLDYLNVDIANYIKHHCSQYKNVIHPLTKELRTVALDILTELHEEEVAQSTIPERT